ncbi:hypothetical protein WA026_013339 [Henosepilachna vigintioctopunctata]|uniref:Uncharacterized protein n=1 Tax=Henosepilachna vigintioctopunctata TaxID=420089 RepID=A0AAW1VFG4_9CUCU
MLYGFSRNIKLHYLFGGMLLRNGEFKLAERYFLKAWSNVDEQMENQLSIEKGLTYVAWNLIPRWNFRWLNSIVIQNAYQKAIFKALSAGYKDVLNIRSNCGHLSLYAGTHKSCSSIISIESSNVLQELGKVLVAQHCPHVNHMSFLASSTNSSKFPNSLKSTRDLLVTDMFDSGFLGHGILDTLYTSFRSLMQRKFKVIPSKVKFYLTGICSNDLDKRYRLRNNIPEIKILDDLCLTRIYGKFRYDSEIYVWYNYEVLTETIEFLQIHLEDKKSVEYFLQGKWCKDVHLVGIKEGLINCLLLRYDIYLDDEIIISNDSLNPDNEVGFEHAIFHCKHPISVKPNERLIFGARIDNKQFNFDFKFGKNLTCKTCISMNEEAIIFLNDKKLVNCIIRLSENITDESKLYIADFSVFPLLGLLLAKRGHQIYYFYPNSRVLKFVAHLIRKNAIDVTRIIFIPYYQHINFVPNLKKLDYIFHEPVHQDGSLKLSPVRNIVFKSLEPKVILGNYSVDFVLVYSNCLKNFNEIDSARVEPFVEFTRLNTHSSREQAYFSKVDHEVMSKPITWQILRKNEKVFSVPIVKKGKINGIMIWYTFYGKGDIRFSTEHSSSISRYAFRFPEVQVEKHDEVAISGKYGGGSLLSMTPLFF